MDYADLIGADPLPPKAIRVKVGITIRSAQYPLGRRRPNGYTGVKGLNALLAIVSTPVSAPMIAATRLRRGGTNSARGAARIVADALVTAKACGAGGLITVRADSAYYTHDVVAAARRGGARFSVTIRMNTAVITAISGIEESLLANAGAAAGVELTSHSFRHFAASALISGGASVKQVQTFLGHASAVITLRTYAHMWPGDEDRTRNVLDAALSPLAGPSDSSSAEATFSQVRGLGDSGSFLGLPEDHGDLVDLGQQAVGHRNVP